MSQIESAIAGYLSGFFAGSLLIFIIIGWFAIQASEDLDRPEFIESLVDTVREDYMEPNEGVFLVAFVFGFFTAIGGGKKAVE